MNDNMILLVDDEANILHSYRRQLQRHYKFETALSGPEGLMKIKENKQFAVVISDKNMPKMDGIEFLKKVKEHSPETVRIMLTGFVDVETSIKAVNEGNIFRFLTKPCSPSLLRDAIDAGIKQYQLITAEKELLGKTLGGSIKIMTEILSMVDSSTFGFVVKLRDMVKKAAVNYKMYNSWEVELAAMLSMIGFITVPAETRDKFFTAKELMSKETEMINEAPRVGSKLISHIPRLESIAKIVLYQNKNYDGSGFPNDKITGLDIPEGARIIRILVDILQLENKGIYNEEMKKAMLDRPGWYDNQILNELLNAFESSVTRNKMSTLEEDINDINLLKVGDLVQTKIETYEGKLLLEAGIQVTQPLLLNLMNYERLGRVKHPIRIVRQENMPK